MPECIAPPIVVRPNPDPTSLTTDQLHREMSWIKELIDHHIVAERQNLADRKELFMDMQATSAKLFNERIDGALREMNMSSEAAKTAVAKSEAGYEKRFESMNEFRQALSDQSAKFITSAESRSLHKASEDKLTELTNRFNLRDGRDGGSATSKSELRSNITAAIGVLSGLAALFLFLSSLSNKVDRNTAAVSAQQPPVTTTTTTR